ncbi:MAG: sulfotransferase domain-containing protein [Chloroflexota bacterium]|nr:MAG: sulfotransferase domain-containing protein [Chloroflexota bacterium]
MPNPLPTVTHIYQNHHIDSTRWNHFVPRRDDIVVATSYKSGTTWMQGILQYLVFLNQPMQSYDDVSPWLDRNRRPLDEVLAELDAQTHRRFIKTHLALDGLPYFPQIKYIVVARDARDVGMSLWNHYSNYTSEMYASLNNAQGRVGPPIPQAPDNFHEFWRNWITRGWFAWENEGYPFWGNLHHTQTWWEYRHLENILFVHFNDLLANTENEISRVADFLNIRVADVKVATIAKSVTLDAMRSDALQRDEGIAESFKGGANTFFFKGINGRWKEILSTDELALYESAKAKNLAPDAAQWLEQGGHI